MKIKNRHQLKSKEIRYILKELSTRFSTSLFSSSSSVERGTLDDYSIILVDNEIDFFKIGEKIFFTLKGLYRFQPQQYAVTVDMGAVGFVVKGADVMAPGIIEADNDIAKNDIVWIRDETHKKPLAVGIALLSGEEMVSTHQGKAIKNIHYIGDTLWNFSH